ncbi:MAG TPA: PAS domain-containing protein [Steroidobacter sp.]
MTWLPAFTHLASLAAGAALAHWLFKRFAQRASGTCVPTNFNDTQRAEQLERQLDRQNGHVQMLLERLSVATRAAGLSCWELDLESEQLVWVGNPIHAFGLDQVPPEHYGARLRALTHPEDREVVKAEMREAIAAGQESFSSRFRLVREDGTTRHMQTFAHIVRDKHGKATRLLGATADITNEIQTTTLLQLKAEEERALLDRLNIATEAAGISSWEIDLKARRFLWIENPLHALAEVANDLEHAFDRLLALMHPEDRAVIEQQFAQALANKTERVSCRYRVELSDGTVVHVHSSARLMIDERGRGTRLLGVSWDVTKEMEAAQTLKDQAQKLLDAERRLERASLSSSEGHWESDLRTGRVWCSSSYHALLGYAPGELPDTIEGLYGLLHPDDLETIRAAMRSHIATDTPFFHCEARMRTRTGEYKWFRHRGMAERNEEGRALTISGSIQDIHEQKLAEDALELVRQRFERAIHGTQDGLWEIERDGAMWCSPRMAELLGYAPEDMPTHIDALSSFLHPDDAITVSSAAAAHFHQGAPYDIEIRLRTKAGDYRWFRARASAERDQNGRALRLSGSVQDVTDARAAREELLRATETAEAANRAKSEFLANVSHEIRTPMNGIIGMTGLLLETKLDRTQRDYAETIRSSADSLLVVINDILDFSKIEAGKLDIERIDLDVRSNVEDVATMLAFQAAAKNLELVVHVHPDVPARVFGDPQRIRQCLINLIGNAIKFTRVGEIVVDVSVAGRRDSQVLTRFEVRDTGIGVPADKLDSLFQPFVQADSSTTRHFGGTGLGLSIVRRLVEMMGGEVGARSKVAEGSVFWFVLPLEPVAANQPMPALDPDRFARRVLVIDDNETNRRVLAGQLMHAGYEVSLAAGGIEGISILRQAAAADHPFDVVLVDSQMQDMDGARLGERINADPELSRARIVMLTSMDRHGDIRHFASLGFAGYLTKPVRTRELLACLERVLACDSKEWHMQSQPIVTRGTLVSNEPPPRYSCNVLLVEDNAVNQKVAVRFLERMGCKVRVADNGAEGVRAYTEGKFDVVLMDLQMPVMDGLAATRRIRQIEHEGGRDQTPIVALTANAMMGQLERCLEAGMNGFLTKPLDISRLHETFDRLGLGKPGTVPTSSHVQADRTPAPVDLARLNELTGGDAEFASELITTFTASGTQVLDEIAQALAAFDRPGLSRAAHKLKGASANVYADRLRGLCESLESQAAQVDQPRLHELIEQVRSEFARAVQFLKSELPARCAKAS